MHIFRIIISILHHCLPPPSYVLSLPSSRFSQIIEILVQSHFPVSQINMNYPRGNGRSQASPNLQRKQYPAFPSASNSNMMPYPQQGSMPQNGPMPGPQNMPQNGRSSSGSGRAYPSRGPGGHPYANMNQPSNYPPPQGYASHPQSQPHQPYSTPHSHSGSANVSHNSLDMTHRTSVANKIREDCYNKFIKENGHNVREISYLSHLLVKEYSQYSATAPPPNVRDSQLGSVKERIVVLCTKYSGRVLLQKGKYNDHKHQYQIGRTWDLDELKALTKVGNNGLILSLNKDYFWRCDEGEERIDKFAKYLTKTYGSFVGKYPVLNGWTIDDFDLPIVPQKKSYSTVTAVPEQTSYPQPDAQLLKSKSLKRKNLPNPVLPVQPQARQTSQSSFAAANTGQQPLPQLALSSDSQVKPAQRTPQNTNPPIQPSSKNQAQSSFPAQNLTPPMSSSSTFPAPQSPADIYKDMDFTSNGKLPMKPMKVMNRSADVSQTSLPETTHTSREYANQTDSPGSNQPYRNVTPTRSEAELTNDSQSFIFGPEDLNEELPKQRTSQPRLASLEQSKLRKVSEPLESKAALNLQLEERLGKPNISFDTSQNSEFGIEEIDTTDDEVKPPFKNKDITPISESEDDLNDMPQSSHIGGTDMGAIDSSIQEIEDFMDSQLNFTSDKSKGQVDGSRLQLNRSIRAPKPPNEVIVIDSLDPDVLEDRSFSMTGNDSSVMNDFTENETEVEDLKIKDSGTALVPDKDPEIEELLDELQWDMEDDCTTLVKKLTGELNKLKYNNVKELTSLDFSGNSMEMDLKTSLDEVDNLSHIFKKMEINFKTLAPEVNAIETNSKGLQLKAVNKRQLYNDLKSIIDKVSISARDLTGIENFSEFDRIKKLEPLENQILILYNALETIRNDQLSLLEDEEPDQLHSMNALKKYLSSYESVASHFIDHFLQFFKQQFGFKIKQLNSYERIYPKSLFVELNTLTIYSSFTFFVKEVSPSDFNDLKLFVTTKLGELLERLLKTRIKTIKYANSQGPVASPNIPSAARLDGSDGLSLKKTRTLRISSRKDKLIGKLGFSEDDHTKPSSPNLGQAPESNLSNSLTSSNGIEDTKTIIDIINDVKDVSEVLTYFIGQIFHYENNVLDLNDFLNYSPFEKRLYNLEQTSIEHLDEYSNDLVSQMTKIFGNYNNLFIKKIVPVEYNIPVLMIYLNSLVSASQTENHDFFVFNFLKKILDRYKHNWTKFVKAQVDLVNKASITAKSGILPSINSINNFFHLTESTLDKPSRIRGDSEDPIIKSMLSESYKEITEACIHLFVKDDPLLKNTEFDERERNYRNVSILQNVFSILEQLVLFNNERTNRVKSQLESVFKKVQDTYFLKLLNQNIGKIVEFINTFEALDDSNIKAKKYNKKAVKNILSGYSVRELTTRAGEIRRKLEKHFISGNNMFEKDLLDKLWSDMEKQFVNYFNRLDLILTRNYSDIDFHISKGEIHSIFRSLS